MLLDPALHIEPAVAVERAELMRADVSFASADEAIDARLGDGSLFTTPRDDARGGGARASRRERRRPLPLAVRARRPSIVAWSEMATEPPPWPQCPTLVVTGERSWIPLRVPRIGNIAHVVVPGGHSVLWDDFDATADAIVAVPG